MKEKTISKEQLVKIVRKMVKENLQKRVADKKMLEESKQKDSIKKISIKELQKMVRESIEEVIKEEKETTSKKNIK